MPIPLLETQRLPPSIPWQAEPWRAKPLHYCHLPHLSPAKSWHGALLIGTVVEQISAVFFSYHSRGSGSYLPF